MNGPELEPLGMNPDQEAINKACLLIWAKDRKQGADLASAWEYFNQTKNQSNRFKTALIPAHDGRMIEAIMEA